jgi:hypothetical protein
MIKKTLTYQDLDGNSVDEEFYFSLSMPEITMMEVSHSNGLEEYLQNIIKSKDGAAIITAMQDMVAMSVGKRSENGRFVEKSSLITQSFMQSGAYEEFFLELVTNADAASEFITGIVPKDMAARIESRTSGAEVKKEYTTAELLQMSHEDFVKAVGSADPMKMSHEHLVIAMQRRNQKVSG